MAKLKIKTDTQIKALKKSGGYLNDDRFSVDSVRNLYLFYYSKTERKVFYFRYAHPLTKARQNLQIGEYPSVTLSQAVRLAVDYNEMLKQGVDPKAEVARLEQEQQSKIHDTFYNLAESYFNGIYQQKAKNDDTRAKNWARLEKHIFPFIGSLHVADIKVKILVGVYERVADRSSTLKKLHQLVSAVMDHAITKGVIDDHNCRLAIKSFYIKPSTPHPTIKQNEIGSLFADLNAANISSQTYLLICFSFLTALRQKEVVNAQWKEFDFKAKLWHIPKERMKGQADKKRPHIIPLSRQALQILEIMKSIAGDSPFVFVGRNGKKPMNEATANTTLKRNGYKGRLVAHGIRAFIKTFLASQKVDRNVSECVLAHLLAGGDELENTYNRYDYLEERKEVMQMIADHLENHGMRIKQLDTV